MREPEYEFVKGVAITFVILLHTMSSITLHSIGYVYYLGQAVPLFILTTFILSYKSLSKRDNYGLVYWYNPTKFIFMIYRIFIPFFIVQGGMWVSTYLIEGPDSAVFAIRGMGPGAYYPWIYLQFWLLMPLLFYALTRLPLIMGGAIFLFINELFQIGCNILGVPDQEYRILFFRYFFLAYLGFLFLKIRMNYFVYIIFAGIGMSYYLSLSFINYKPFLFDSWNSQQFPAYFYTFVFFHYLLYLYKKCGNNIIGKYFVRIGGYSWTIFLLQMYFVKMTIRYDFSRFGGSMTPFLYVISIYFLCIVPILIYDRMRICYLER